MRRFTSIILIIALVISLSACSSQIKTDAKVNTVIKPGNEADKLELTILFNTSDKNYSSLKYFQQYIKQFEQKYGVKIKSVYLGSGAMTEEGDKDFKADLAAKLYLSEGPELIFVEPHFQISEYIKQNAVTDLAGNVKNMDKIYEGLLKDGTYFAPIGLSYIKWSIDRELLKDIGVEEPDLNWTSAQFYKMFDAWSKKYKYFTNNEYYNLLKQYTNNFETYSIANNHLSIDREAFVNSIKKIREEIFSGKFSLPRDYSYENYYNMFYESTSEEYKKAFNFRFSDLYKDNSIAYLGGGNLLVSNFIEKKGYFYLPQFSDEKYAVIHGFGFMVNKNGKNLNLAYEFINGMLDKEFQISMYNADQDLTGFSLYPANKELEEYVRKLEIDSKYNERAIKLKEHALKQIKDGRVKLYAFQFSGKESKIEAMIMKAMSKYIFADSTYSDEEISKELEALEAQCNIYLSE